MKSATVPTSPTPVSASPVTNSKFLPQNRSSEPNGQIRNSSPGKTDDSITTPINSLSVNTSNNQENQKLDLDAEIATRLSNKKSNNDDNNDELTNLLSKQDRS